MAIYDFRELKNLRLSIIATKSQRLKETLSINRTRKLKISKT